MDWIETQKKSLNEYLDLLRNNYKEMNEIILRDTIYACIRLMWESKSEYMLESFIKELYNKEIISSFKDDILVYCSGMIEKCLQQHKNEGKI